MGGKCSTCNISHGRDCTPVLTGLCTEGCIPTGLDFSDAQLLVEGTLLSSEVGVCRKNPLHDGFRLCLSNPVFGEQFSNCISHKWYCINKRLGASNEHLGLRRFFFLGEVVTCLVV